MKQDNSSIFEYITVINELVFNHISEDEIEQGLSLMKKHSNEWYEVSIFVYRLFSFAMNKTELIKVLTKSTGYKRASIYNLRKAGKQIFQNSISKQDINKQTLMEFLDYKYAPNEGIITEIEEIGNYHYQLPNNSLEKVFIYNGIYNGRTIFFKSKCKIDINIEVVILNEIDDDGKEKLVQKYYYNGNEIALYNFEPRCNNPAINLLYNSSL